MPSAVATPNLNPCTTVRRMHKILIGPTGAATATPNTNALRNNSTIGLDFDYMNINNRLLAQLITQELAHGGADGLADFVYRMLWCHTADCLTYFICQCINQVFIFIRVK